MARSLRRVPCDWVHPTDNNGDPIPMHAYPPRLTPDEIAEGLADGWLVNDPPNYGVPVMPQWTADQAPCYQVYENTTEGTPVSPVIGSIDGVIAFAAGLRRTSREDAEQSVAAWLAEDRGQRRHSAARAALWHYRRDMTW